MVGPLDLGQPTVGRPVRSTVGNTADDQQKMQRGAWSVGPEVPGTVPKGRVENEAWAGDSQETV